MERYWIYKHGRLIGAARLSRSTVAKIHGQNGYVLVLVSGGAK